MIQDVRDCVGCTACLAACPANCISMAEDAEGFLKPSVDEPKCIHCGKCRKVCPALGVPQRQAVVGSWCGWHNDADLRSRSSSGGAFAAVANAVVKAGGVAYGAVFDPETKGVTHRSTDEAALDRLQRSKYVQSHPADTFRRIQTELQSGRPVLFCGTPCQVNGLRNLLGTPTNLFTCDFSCHGVPSRRVFADYLQSLESAHGSRIADINFRSKVRGWTRSNIVVTFEDGTVYQKANGTDPFYRGFLDNYYLNRCCYTCRHNANHSSDLILADFWEFARFNAALNDDRGLSLVIANSQQGLRMVANLGETFTLIGVPAEKSRYCLGTPGKTREASRKRFDEFFSVYHRAGYRAAMRRYVRTDRLAVFLRKIERVRRIGIVKWAAGRLGRVTRSAR